MPPGQGELNSRERDLLEFERDWPVHQGSKQAAITERFGISAARYYQLLAKLVDKPAAMEYDPLTVRRIHRRRRELEQRRAARVADVVHPR